MPPIFLSGRYTFSLLTETGTCYIGPHKRIPDAIGILPGDVDPRPIFTLDHVDGNKYIISIDGRSVGERWDGELILEPHDADASREWKIVPSGDEGHRIRGDSVHESYWSRSRLLNSVSRFDMESENVIKEVTIVNHRGGCSGTPSPCLTLQIAPITE